MKKVNKRDESPIRLYTIRVACPSCGHEWKTLDTLPMADEAEAIRLHCWACREHHRRWHEHQATVDDALPF